MISAPVPRIAPSSASRYTPRMKLEPFAMERLQSIWENRVAWNVSESGVHPLRVEELAETDDERQRGAGAGPRLPADERHAAAARVDRRDVSGRHDRSRPGHQRRLGSQLHRAAGTSSSRATRW